MKIIEAFNKTRTENYGNLWEGYSPLAHSAKQRLVRIFSSHNVFKPGGNILDVACGKGTLYPFMQQAKHITELDASTYMLQNAQGHAEELGIEKKVTCIQADGANTNLPSNSFDTVIVFNGLPHFSDKFAAIKEWGRVLKINGELVIAHSKNRLQLNASAKKYNPGLIGDVLPTSADLIEMTTHAGLSITDIVDDAAIDYFLVKAIKL